jgi:hypothetical protein
MGEVKEEKIFYLLFDDDLNLVFITFDRTNFIFR